MKIPFSPPDIGEAEIEEVVAALKSGWITTDQRPKNWSVRWHSSPHFQSGLLKFRNRSIGTDSASTRDRSWG